MKLSQKYKHLIDLLTIAIAGISVVVFVILFFLLAEVINRGFYG